MRFIEKPGDISEIAGTLLLTLTHFLRRATAAACGLVLAGAVSAAEITVFAAASLSTALDEIADEWSETEGRVRIAYAGSSALARQIEAGAPADLFISANAAWMDWLEERGRILQGTRVDLLGNSLVVIARSPADPIALDDLPSVLGTDRLALALTDAVPAGIYAKAALQHLGHWSALASQSAEAENVRVALAYVASGAAPYGIVYRTDALAEARVNIVAEIPETAHPSIVYPAAILPGRAEGAAQRFLDHLRGPGARAAFAAQGFLPALR